jgi:MHS family proline/betaine transporter-like MFS transporter
LRLSVPDSPKFTELREAEEVSRSPIRESLRGYLKPIFITGGVFLFWSVSQQSAFTYHIAHVTTTAELSLPSALSANTMSLVVFAVLVPLMGLLSDRVGRKPLLIASCLGLIVVSYPTFLLMAQGTFWSFFFAQSIFAIFLAMMSGPAPAALAELFATKVRVVSVMIGTMAALALFGTPAPALDTWLVGATGSASAPAFWLIVTALVTLLVVIFYMREGARRPLE